jgi:3'(2'), 5'-bisphosphate nucleotidase
MATGKYSFMVPEIVRVARAAGAEILKIYRSGAWTVSSKGDDSPLTQADLAANDIILRGLKAISTDPIVSEENDPHSVITGDRFWLVDPLDGTRDFVARLDTFVVSIGLIENGRPVLGVIYAPVTDETFWAALGEGAYRDGEKIYNRSTREKPIAAGSRSIPSDRMKQFAELFSIEEVLRFGSALKFCRLAEGKIDLYPRFGLMHEWDTAAGQIIAEEAGCKVIEVSSGAILGYGKPGLVHRGGFIASRSDLEIVGRLKENEIYLKK